MRKKPQNIKDLNEKQRRFVEIMARGYEGTGRRLHKLTQREAYLQAGYPEGSGANNNAWRLYTKLKPFIMELREEILQTSQIATIATQVIENIMLDENTSEAIRLKAAQDILHRTGHDKPKEISMTRKVSDMDEQEIDAELDELIGKSDNITALKQA